MYDSFLARFLLTASIALALVRVALTAELEPLKPSPSLDETFAGCSEDRAPTTRNIHLIDRDSLRHDVGPYSVQLPGYSAGVGDDSYAPMRIEACPGDTMQIELENKLPTNYVQGDTNLHTHGLIVRPTPDKPGPPGDYIFLDVPPGHTEKYRISIPRDLPGSMFGDSKVHQPYPSGLYWFHAHRHGFARNQVQAGEAGLLSIGNPLEIAYRDDQGKTVVQNLPPETQVSYLALRDIQLAVPPGSRPSRANGQAAEWLNGLDGRLDYDSTACNATKQTWLENGACGHTGLTVNGQPRDLAWLFTINGQLFPKIDYSADRPQLWRIANISSNVTYVLEIASGDNPLPDAAKRRFFVLTLDGLVAGTPIENEPFELLGIGLHQLLLMPGSRAEIYLPSNQCGGVATLRTAGLQTGPNPQSAPTGDPWPAIRLARVEATHSKDCIETQSSGPGMASRPAELNIKIPGRDSLLSQPTPGANAPMMLKLVRPETPDAVTSLSNLHPSCVFLPPAANGMSYRRRIYFEEDTTPNSPNPFTVGSEVVDADGKSVSGTKIGPEIFPDPMNWKTQKHLCPVLGAEEVWELVNDTDEMHNFHIHQSKFRLADSKLDEGVPAGLKAVVSTDPNCDQQPAKVAFCDPMGLIGKSVPEAGGAIPDQAVDLWHDTIPVPPRSSDGNPGRVFVSIPFKSSEQEGRFVFHCHILEHEDAGMMAPIEVLSAAALARQQQDEPLPTMRTHHKRADSGPSSGPISLDKPATTEASFEQALAGSMCTSDFTAQTLSKPGR